MPAIVWQSLIMMYIYWSETEIIWIFWNLLSIFFSWNEWMNLFSVGLSHLELLCGGTLVLFGLVKFRWSWVTWLNSNSNLNIVN